METATQEKESPAGATGVASENTGTNNGTPAVEVNDSGLNGNAETTTVVGATTEAPTATPASSAEDKSQAQAQEGAGDDKKQQASGKAKPTFAHIEIMEKNNLTTEQLPKELRQAINAWNMGMRKYNKQKTEKLMEMMRKGSFKLADSIQNFLEKDLPEKSEEEIKVEQQAQENARKTAEFSQFVTEGDNKLSAKDFDGAIAEYAKALELKINDDIASQKISEAQRIKSEQDKAGQEERVRREREVRAKAEEERKERELRIKQNRPVTAPRPIQKTSEQKVAEILAEKGKIRYKELVEILGTDNFGEQVSVGSIKLLNIYFTNNYKQI